VNTHKLADNVAVITVSYNSSAQLESFLNSAVNSVSDPSQIFVADNASSDISSTRKLCTLFKVNLVELEKNLGYGGAINAVVSGLPESFDVLLISNPDTSLNAPAISTLGGIASWPNVGVVGPRILNEDGTSSPSARAIPSIRNGVGHGLFSHLWKRNPWTRNYLTNSHLQDKTIATGWVSGACLAIRKDLFIKVSGFDDMYFMYFEDVDLGYRLGQLGFTNIYTPQASVVHKGGESTKELREKMLRTHHQSAVRFLEIKYRGFYWAPVRKIIEFGLNIRFFMTNK
jgi:N-acetylglucosaminyl-diphospho-decaprenol L-rhamnosyltransferase